MGFKTFCIIFNSGNCIPKYQAFSFGASTLATSLLWILQASIWGVSRFWKCKYSIISYIFDNYNARIYLNTLIKHNNSKCDRRKAIDSKTPASSVVAQMDASDLNSRRDDDRDINTNVCDSPNDVRTAMPKGILPWQKMLGGILTLLPRSSTRNCYIQHPSALLSGNISKPLSSVSELTSPCTLFLLM
jgi:hypothetical protein